MAKGKKSGPPKFVLLNKDKDTRKSVRIAACFANEYGGEDISFSIRGEDGEYHDLKELVFADGTRIPAGWIQRRENIPYEQRQKFDSADDDL